MLPPSSYRAIDRESTFRNLYAFACAKFEPTLHVAVSTKPAISLDISLTRRIKISSRVEIAVFHYDRESYFSLDSYYSRMNEQCELRMGSLKFSVCSYRDSSIIHRHRAYDDATVQMSAVTVQTTTFSAVNFVLTCFAECKRKKIYSRARYYNFQKIGSLKVEIGSEGISGISRVAFPRSASLSKISVRRYFTNFRGERRGENSGGRLRRARHVPESQGITLEVDRRISFSIEIRAWEEFISVASSPTFVREISLNGRTDTRSTRCRSPNIGVSSSPSPSSLSQGLAYANNQQHSATSAQRRVAQKSCRLLRFM